MSDFLGWLDSAWDFVWALPSGAWAALAAWITVVIAGGTVVVTGIYAKKQIAQAQDQLVQAERASLAQRREADEARQMSETARLEQLAQAELTREQQAKDAQQLREEQAQPNVVMFTEPDANHWQYLELVVKNFGKTPAHNVRLFFSPVPTVAPFENLVTGAQVTHLAYPDEIPFLAPGQEWRTLWDSAVNRVDYDREHDEPLQSRFDATLTFEDSKGKPFTSRSVLDWATMAPATRVDTKTIHDLATTLDKQLKDINKQISSVAKTLDGFGQEHSGVWVYADPGPREAEYRADRERQREAVQQERKERRERMLRRVLPQQFPPEAETTEQSDEAPPHSTEPTNPPAEEPTPDA